MDSPRPLYRQDVIKQPTDSRPSGRDENRWIQTNRGKDGHLTKDVIGLSLIHCAAMIATHSSDLTSHPDTLRTLT